MLRQTLHVNTRNSSESIAHQSCPTDCNKDADYVRRDTWSTT